ncbi:hypothetical protein [Streptomyces lasiicapitis]|uniref:hypothetical protein n=1 Tax=Streptomyces lasiicapitis TaxID=1923961 RepID=UPI003652F995
MAVEDLLPRLGEVGQQDAPGHAVDGEVGPVAVAGYAVYQGGGVDGAGGGDHKAGAGHGPRNGYAYGLAHGFAGGLRGGFTARSRTGARSGLLAGPRGARTPRALRGDAAGQFGLGPALGLPGEHDLERRMVRGGPLGVEDLHETLEGRVLTVVHGQGLALHLLHPAEQFLVHGEVDAVAPVAESTLSGALSSPNSSRCQSV